MRINPRGGCAAKLSGLPLVELLGEAYRLVYGAAIPHPMMAPYDSALLDVGDSRALMVSADQMPVFGPDPEIAGRIAALHAMSDLFASGADPRWALPVIVVCPRALEQAQSVLVGLLRACRSEGVAVVGGHTSTGSEALIGLCVLGVPASDRSLGKLGAHEGDRLFLSKPVGTGLILHAVAAGELPTEALDIAIETMLISNRVAGTAALGAEATASTDVSGFGLLGHLAEMLGDRLGARVNSGGVPTLPYVDLMSSPFRRGGAIRANHDYVAERLTLTGVSDIDRLAPLLDPQTNGGLLITAPTDRTSELRAASFVEIGTITSTSGIVIE
jgi:selenide,water dikinase